MALAYVESPADPRLDTFRFIGDSAELERRGLVVVEGRLVVDRLLAESTLRVDALLLTAAAARAMAAVLARVPASVAVSIVPQQWMQGITGFNLHRGSIAIARRPRAATVAELLAGGARRLLVLEGVGNPAPPGPSASMASSSGRGAAIPSIAKRFACRAVEPLSCRSRTTLTGRAPSTSSNAMESSSSRSRRTRRFHRLTTWPRGARRRAAPLCFLAPKARD
jgi:hypothetical protein